jgi:hypothetical protein
MSRTPSTASFERVEEKQTEMGFFLSRLAECELNMFAFRCYFSAFASSAMSVLYALESARKRIDPHFRAWYEPRRAKLIEEDPITSYVLERRSESIHTGETRVRSGLFRPQKNGKPMVEHFFSLGWQRAERIDVDVLTACRHTHDAIAHLVLEVLDAFPHLSPDYFMDEETLKREGLTVEDIEESMGLPRGWTFIEGWTTQQRLDALHSSL